MLGSPIVLCARIVDSIEHVNRQHCDWEMGSNGRSVWNSHPKQTNRKSFSIFFSISFLNWHDVRRA